MSTNTTERSEDMTESERSGETTKTYIETKEIPIDTIAPNPYQPRLEFDDETIEEIGDSIDRVGLSNAIEVRPLNADSDYDYQLVSGEQRVRGKRRKGHKTIRAEIHDIGDELMRWRAFEENNARDDLDDVEAGDLWYEGFMANDELGPLLENLDGFPDDKQAHRKEIAKEIGSVRHGSFGKELEKSPQPGETSIYSDMGEIDERRYRLLSIIESRSGASPRSVESWLNASSAIGAVRKAVKRPPENPTSISTRTAEYLSIHDEETQEALSAKFESTSFTDEQQRALSASYNDISEELQEIVTDRDDDNTVPEYSKAIGTGYEADEDEDRSDEEIPDSQHADLYRLMDQANVPTDKESCNEFVGAVLSLPDEARQVFYDAERSDIVRSVIIDLADRGTKNRQPVTAKTIVGESLSAGDAKKFITAMKPSRAKDALYHYFFESNSVPFNLLAFIHAAQVPAEWVGEEDNEADTQSEVYDKIRLQRMEEDLAEEFAGRVKGALEADDNRTLNWLLDKEAVYHSEAEPPHDPGDIEVSDELNQNIEEAVAGFSEVIDESAGREKKETRQNLTAHMTFTDRLEQAYCPRCEGPDELETALEGIEDEDSEEGLVWSCCGLSVKAGLATMDKLVDESLGGSTASVGDDSDEGGAL
jgi:ParB-like chromosome segregation protein Spo0J